MVNGTEELIYFRNRVEAVSPEILEWLDELEARIAQLEQQAALAPRSDPT